MTRMSLNMSYGNEMISLGNFMKVNWSSISTIALTATSADLVPGAGTYQGNNQFAYYGAYLTALSGTNAAVGLTLST